MQLGSGTFLFKKELKTIEQEFQNEILSVCKLSPFRRMMTTSGHLMNVSMTNCGPFGWFSDRKGYRYEPCDPMFKKSWPAMPSLFRNLAIEFAEKSGYNNFEPDACLINRYAPGNQLTLHQDKDETDFSQPIVSFSFGLPAFFMWGGHKRSDEAKRVILENGDILVWGGEDRLRFHGIAPLPSGYHPVFGDSRINLTFRKV